MFFRKKETEEDIKKRLEYEEKRKEDERLRKERIEYYESKIKSLEYGEKYDENKHVICIPEDFISDISIGRKRHQIFESQMFYYYQGLNLDGKTVKMKFAFPQFLKKEACEGICYLIKYFKFCPIIVSLNNISDEYIRCLPKLSIYGVDDSPEWVNEIIAKNVFDPVIRTNLLYVDSFYEG